MAPALRELRAPPNQQQILGTFAARAAYWRLAKAEHLSFKLCCFAASFPLGIEVRRIFLKYAGKNDVKPICPFALSRFNSRRFWARGVNVLVLNRS
jgi:hypothetical protein